MIIIITMIIIIIIIITIIIIIIVIIIIIAINNKIYIMYKSNNKNFAVNMHWLVPFSINVSLYLLAKSFVVVALLSF